MFACIDADLGPTAELEEVSTTEARGDEPGTSGRCSLVRVPDTLLDACGVRSFTGVKFALPDSLRRDEFVAVALSLRLGGKVLRVVLEAGTLEERTVVRFEVRLELHDSDVAPACEDRVSTAFSAISAACEEVGIGSAYLLRGPPAEAIEMMIGYGNKRTR